MMGSSARTVVVLGTLSLVFVLDAGKLRKEKRPKPIDWNDPYYSGRFDLCKKLRKFNPVETMKAQAWAAEKFKECGPRTVISFATEYDFPAYGIERITLLMCYATNFGYAFFSSNGTLRIDSNVKSVDFLRLATATHEAFKAANHSFTVTHRGKSYIIPPDPLYHFVYTLMDCAFAEEYVKQLDGDVVKHAIVHARVMLL